MPYDGTDLSPVTEKNIAKVRAKENLARLRDFIGQLPAEAFDMTLWDNGFMAKCGSVGCIGGWAEFLFKQDPEVPGNVLGLSERQGKSLFYPESVRSWSRITQRQAMVAIDNVIACGWPKWREAIKVR